MDIDMQNESLNLDKIISGLNLSPEILDVC